MMHMLKITRPCLIFCDVDRYDFAVECLNTVGLKIEIFTFDGQKGHSKIGSLRPVVKVNFCKFNHSKKINIPNIHLN